MQQGPMFARTPPAEASEFPVRYWSMLGQPASFRKCGEYRFRITMDSPVKSERCAFLTNYLSSAVPIVPTNEHVYSTNAFFCRIGSQDASPRRHKDLSLPRSPAKLASRRGVAPCAAFGSDPDEPLSSLAG